MLKLIVADDYDAMSRTAADLLAAQLAEKPDATVLLPTGNTPVGLYRELVERVQQGTLDLSCATIVQLDDYLGLDDDDERSLYRWLHTALLAPAGITPERVIRLRGDSPNPLATCMEFERHVVSAGGLDLSVLGLGTNGHLGFNEPPADPQSPTHMLELTPATLEANASYWGGRDRVPRRAITAGLRMLLAARATLLLVASEQKRSILSQVVQGPVTAQVPGSFLQWATNVTIVSDRAAVSECAALVGR